MNDTSTPDSTSTEGATDTRHSPLINRLANGVDNLADLLMRGRLTRLGTVLLPGFDVNEPDPATPDSLPEHMQGAIDTIVAVIVRLPAAERPTLRLIEGRASQTPRVAPGDTAALDARQAYNQLLTERRAAAVFKALERGFQAAGVSGVMGQAVPVGGGENFPWLNLPDGEHVLNRSVELSWEVPSPQTLELPPAPAGDWGKLRISLSVTVNLAGIFLLAKGLAKEGIELISMIGEPGKKFNPVEYVELKAGTGAAVGKLTQAGETRSFAILFGVAAAGVKPPRSEPFDVVNLVEFEHPLDEGDAVHAYRVGLTLDDLDGATVHSVTGTLGGNFFAGEGGSLVFLDTWRGMRPLACSKGSGPAATTGLVPSVAVNFKSGMLKVYPDDRDLNPLTALFDVASEPGKYLFAEAMASLLVVQDQPSGAGED